MPPLKCSARDPTKSESTTSDCATVASVPEVTRVLSCIQPTGSVHLGNYLGALVNWVSGQHESEVFHGIVDLHALTVTDQPKVLGVQTLELAAMLFAVGLDPCAPPSLYRVISTNTANWRGSWSARFPLVNFLE